MYPPPQKKHSHTHHHTHAAGVVLSASVIHRLLVGARVQCCDNSASILRPVGDSGLEYIHERRLVHLDIAARNILVGQVFLFLAWALF